MAVVVDVEIFGETGRRRCTLEAQVENLALQRMLWVSDIIALVDHVV